MFMLHSFSFSLCLSLCQPPSYFSPRPTSMSKPCNNKPCQQTILINVFTNIGRTFEWCRCLFIANFKHIFHFSGEIDTVLSHRLNKVNSSESKSSHIHQHQPENVSGILSNDNETNTSKPNQV